jgi:hypothetical protein
VHLGHVEPPARLLEESACALEALHVAEEHGRRGGRAGRVPLAPPNTSLRYFVARSSQHCHRLEEPSRSGNVVDSC